ncbi:MAG TPA: hypothetical protein VN255_08185 [Mycobacterium sp.]|nr:hypothetical protein [Mycobacterium sp.]
MILKFTVPGKPVPQGSKRHVGRGILVESSRELGPWRERVALAAHHALAGAAPFVGAVAVGLEFVLPRPINYPGMVSAYAQLLANGDTNE